MTMRDNVPLFVGLAWALAFEAVVGAVLLALWLLWVA